MSVEQQVFDLVELGANKAAPEITHALSSVGCGSMIEGIKKVWEAGIDIGMERGFLIGFKAGEKAGLYNGVAIGAVGGTVVICAGFFGIKWWREHHAVRAKDTAISTPCGEIQSEESDISDIEFSHSNAIPEEESMESENLE